MRASLHHRLARAGRFAELPDTHLLGAAHERLYRLGERVRAQGEPWLLESWRRLGTSDHCYYMCTKWFADGDVHKCFNPHESPYDAFVAFMNALTDLERRCDARPMRAGAPLGEMAVAV